MRRSEVPILVILLVAIFCLLSLHNYPSSQSAQIMNEGPDPRVKGQFKEWKECLQRNITLYQMDPKGLWSNLWKGVKLCEKLPFMNDLKIENFNNADETKRHIPSLKKEPSVIVTLGIGHDTAAEEALLKVLPAGSKFYGADPMHEVNEALYTKFGSYFPFAVGGSSKVSTASVLINNSYVPRSVVHIDLAYFLSEILGHKVYDDLWIDAEGAEYEMFPYFYRGGKLDQYGITLCQFNMENEVRSDWEGSVKLLLKPNVEDLSRQVVPRLSIADRVMDEVFKVHYPDDAKKKLFHTFIFEILKGNRYAFFRPVQGAHMRLYFLNFSDKRCVSKYIFRKTN